MIELWPPEWIPLVICSESGEGARSSKPQSTSEKPSGGKGDKSSHQRSGSGVEDSSSKVDPVEKERGGGGGKRERRNSGQSQASDKEGRGGSSKDKVKNKERPAMEIYRPGMGRRYLFQLENFKNSDH